MVPTDTHDRGGYMGGCSATLTSSSVVDGRPDRPSRGRWRIVPDVCRECSLKSIHCSKKVHDSYLSRTPGPDKFTRPSVRTRRGNHPAPSGRPPRGGAKVTWFRYSCEYRKYSRDDPGDLTICSKILSTHGDGLRLARNTRRSQKTDHFHDTSEARAGSASSAA